MKKRIAILATHGFEESELSSPKAHLEKQGWEVSIISPQKGAIKSWAEKDWGKEYPVDQSLESADSTAFDALVLPGGVLNPDKLRTQEPVLNFIRDFVDQGKLLAAICHGPQLLINAGLVNGRRLTSVDAIRVDLVNAGAEWVDEEVVVDDGLVTSRTPKDLPAFNAKITELIQAQVAVE